MRWLLAALLLGCGDDYQAAPPDALVETFDARQPFRPGDPINLTSDNPAGDEDPFLFTGDPYGDSLSAIYFSRVSGNADLFLNGTRDGRSWGRPGLRLTEDPADDFYPSAATNGSDLHVAWFRKQPAPPFDSWIVYNAKGFLDDWDPANEVRVTDGSGLDDWVPTLAINPAGVFQIVFVSRNRGGGTADLYVVTSMDDGATWTSPAPVNLLNDPVLNDHLPRLFNTGTSMVIAWVRCDDSNPIPWMNPTAEIYISTSPEGVTWEPPLALTQDSTIDVFPELYLRADEPWVAWVTAAISPEGTIVTAPISDPSVPTELPWSGPGR